LRQIYRVRLKPGKHDRKHQTLIAGVELDELKRHTWLMAESFGLDRRIKQEYDEAYE
jgi:hypothetical protein